MLINSKDSLIVVVLLSSVLLIITTISILLALKFKKYHLRPYLLACCFFLFQVLGISGILLIAILKGRNNAPFDTIMRPATLITGFVTLIFILSYIVEIKFPGKMNFKSFLLSISPFIAVSAALILIPNSEVHHPMEIVNNLKRPDILLRLMLVLLFIAYPVVPACLPYDWHKCLVSRKAIVWLHILTCLIAPAFVAGLVCGYFPAVILNYIIAISLDSLIVYIELKIRIPVSESYQDNKFCQGQEESYLDQKESETLLITPAIWMNPDMTVTELAKVLGTNRTYLLEKIKRLGYSCYSDMINRKRVEYVCEELEKDADINITTLMFEAGFRSRSTANREFKRIVGCTPSEYQESR